MAFDWIQSKFLNLAWNLVVSMFLLGLKGEAQHRFESTQRQFDDQPKVHNKEKLYLQTKFDEIFNYSAVNICIFNFYLRAVDVGNYNDDDDDSKKLLSNIFLLDHSRPSNEIISHHKLLESFQHISFFVEF